MTTAIPTATDLVERLAKETKLGSVPRKELEWLVAHSTLMRFNPGDVLTRKDELAPAMMVMLTGRLVIWADRGAGARKIIEWNKGEVGGMLPYSRGARAPADAIFDEPSELLVTAQEEFPEMIRECPGITTICVHVMVDRARFFKAGDLLDEKLVSLGKLAAGLAHELNNPASAASRSAKLLSDSLRVADDAAIAVGRLQLTEAQHAEIAKLRDVCAAPGDHMPPMARADREDALAEWLSEHDADEGSAAALAGTRVTISTLDALATTVTGPALDAVLRWVAAGCTVRALASEIEMATGRIYDLVNSVKGFTFMDRAPTLEPVDIRRGITDTLRMLAQKTRAKDAEVVLQFAEDLPKARAIGGELNQVWMNLIDNALDAIASGGRIGVTAGRDHAGRVVVQISDDGPGIPPELQARIFDPFFTTKDVGGGTGLGLDTVRRILQRHDAEIDLESRPGYTQFRVALPAA